MFKINKMDYRYPDQDNNFTLSIDDLAFQTHQIVGLIGANGCGKSTFYRILSGMLQSKNMSLSFGNQDYKSLLDTDLKIGFHNAFAPLISTLTARQNLEFYARLHRVKDIDNAIDKVAYQYDVLQLLNKYPSKLSQGQQHRVKLCLTMVHNPDIILFDEPTVASDILMIETILASIEAIRALGKLVFFSTHHIYELTQLKPRLIGMQDGQIAFDTPWHEKFNQREYLSHAMLGIMSKEQEYAYV